MIRCLTIAGSDSGGGAGIQADLKTFAAHSVHGMSVVTAVTAQNTRDVLDVHLVPPEAVEAQIKAVMDDIGADTIKIGMLGTAEIVRAVARVRGIFRLSEHKSADLLSVFPLQALAMYPNVPIVVDPVMVSKGGQNLLLDEKAIAALKSELIPLATLITPNFPGTLLFGGLT